jgi:DNA polymerase III subunit epsilon
VTAWHLGPMAAFDTESTGKFAERDRLVTACVSWVDGSGNTKPQTKTWLADPGVDIHPEAAKIHGITTEHAREHGSSPAFVLAEIAEELLRAAAEGIPVVAFNIPFDFTLTDRETRRNGLDPFGPAFEAAGGFAIDALVLDKALDTYRKGKRTLGVIAEHYGVRAGKAHDAAGDALTAARVAYAIGQRYPRIAEMPLAEHFAKTGKPEQVDGSWPWKPWTGDDS